MKQLIEIQNTIKKIRSQLAAESAKQHEHLRNALALMADDIDKVADAALEPTLDELFDFANTLQYRLGQIVAGTAEFRMRQRNTERALAAVDPELSTPPPATSIGFDGTKRQTKLKAIGG